MVPRASRWLSRIAPVLFVALGAAGCSDDDGESVDALAQGVNGAKPSPTGGPVSHDPNRFFGFNVMGLARGESPSIQGAAVRIWDVLGTTPGSGAAWARIETSPGVYDWSALDAAVATAKAHGATTISYVASGTPSFYATSKDASDCALLWDADRSTSPAKPYLCSAPWVGADSASVPSAAGRAAFVKFVSAAAARYKGRITAYEIWNEPSLAMFWRGSSDASSWDHLATMTKQAYRAIKAIDPDAAVLSASLVPRNAGWETGRDRKYLTALEAAGWPVDAFNFHGYPEVGLPGADRHEAQIGQVRELLFSTMRAPSRPLWETEHDYNVGGTGNPEPAPVIANEIARSYLAVRRAHVDALFWYAWNHTDTQMFGAQFVPGSVATQTVEQMQLWLSAATLEAPNASTEPVVSTAYRFGAERRVILYTKSGSATVPRPEGLAIMCTVGSRVCAPAPETITVTTTPILLAPSIPSGHK